MAQGETQDEALANLIDAVQGVIAVKMEQDFREVRSAPTTGELRFTVSL